MESVPDSQNIYFNTPKGEAVLKSLLDSVEQFPQGLVKMHLTRFLEVVIAKLQEGTGMVSQIAIRRIFVTTYYDFVVDQVRVKQLDPKELTSLTPDAAELFSSSVSTGKNIILGLIALALKLKIKLPVIPEGNLSEQQFLMFLAELAVCFENYLVEQTKQ